MAKASQRHERFMQNKSDNGCPPLATLPNKRLIIVCEREPKSQISRRGSIKKLTNTFLRDILFILLDYSLGLQLQADL